MNYRDELAEIIEFTSASSMMRELKGAGYEINRSDSPSALSGNRMNIRRGAPLSEFWHESGHALDMHGTEEGLQRTQGLADMQKSGQAGGEPFSEYNKSVRGFENRANATAQQAIRDRGGSEDYVKQYRKEVAPYTNTYRAGSDGTVRTPAAKTPVDNAWGKRWSGTTDKTASLGRSIAGDIPHAAPKIAGAPIKRGFGMKGALGVAAVGAAGIGLYAGYNAIKRREQNNQMSARDELHCIIEFGLLGHPLKYSRPYIQRDGSMLQGTGKYESPEAFRLNNTGEQFAKGQDRQISKARRAGVISVGTKKDNGGWKSIATADGLKQARDAKKAVIKHELIHSIQRAKSERWQRKQLNPIRMFLDEVGAYSAEHRGMKGRTIMDKAFPTFKAMPRAITSTDAANGISKKIKSIAQPIIRRIAAMPLPL